MSNEMKPCPFCGAFAVFRLTMQWAIIECSANGLGCPVGPSVARERFSDAQTAWNTRHDPR
jgi:hypothetical protein